MVNHSEDYNGNTSFTSCMATLLISKMLTTIHVVGTKNMRKYGYSHDVVYYDKFIFSYFIPRYCHNILFTCTQSYVLRFLLINVWGNIQINFCS